VSLALIHKPTGTPNQSAGSAGCVSDHGPKGACIAARHLTEANGIAISPEGKSLSIGNYNRPSMAVFGRDPATGTLTQKSGSAGCFTEDGSGECSSGRAFAGGFGLTRRRAFPGLSGRRSSGRAINRSAECRGRRASWPFGRRLLQHRRLRPLCAKPLAHGDSRGINHLGGGTPMVPRLQDQEQPACSRMSHCRSLRHCRGMSDNEKQFLEIYRANEADLGRFLISMVRDVSLAEDILQEVWAVAWKDRASIAAHPEPRAWVFMTARNRALGELRRSRRASRALLALISRPEEQVSLPSQAVEVLDLLERNLSHADRALFVLRYSHGFTAAELARMSGESHQAIRKRLSRARAKLADAATPIPDPLSLSQRRPCDDYQRA
jgi:RNA polymerase sigma factor (sigma-70 family)